MSCKPNAVASPAKGLREPAERTSSNQVTSRRYGLKRGNSRPPRGVPGTQGQAVPSSLRLSLPPRPYWTSYSTKFDRSFHESWYGEIVYSGLEMRPDALPPSSSQPTGETSQGAGHVLAVLLRAGSRVLNQAGGWLTEHDVLASFYPDRWYNCCRVFRPDGPLAFVYCHVATPARIANGLITWVDLDLDVLVQPDGSFQILAEGEFATNARQWGYPPNVLARAWAAGAELASMAARRASPFDHLSGTLQDMVERELLRWETEGQASRHG